MCQASLLKILYHFRIVVTFGKREQCHLLKLCFILGAGNLKQELQNARIQKI